MLTIDPLWIFLVLAAAFGTLSAKSYLGNERQWTTPAKNHARMALMFAAVSVYLMFTGTSA